MKIPIDPLKFTPVISFLYKLWCKTIRFNEVKGQWSDVRERLEGGQKVVLALWHDEIFPLVGYGVGDKKGESMVTLVSQSKDGEIITRVLESLGHMPARGSSSRGGLRAMLKAKRIMEKENRIAVFTVDGPRGPRHVSKDGPIFLANIAGAYIQPIRACCQKKYVFEKSWDKFQVPMPFSKVDVYLGEPMFVPEGKLTEEQVASCRAELEERLERLV